MRAQLLGYQAGPFGRLDHERDATGVHVPRPGRRTEKRPKQPPMRPGTRAGTRVAARRAGRHASRRTPDGSPLHHHVERSDHVQERAGDAGAYRLARLCSVEAVPRT